MLCCITSSGQLDLVLEAVVELGSSAQQEVDAGAEGGVGGQVQRHEAALHLSPHTTHQLLVGEGGKSRYFLVSQSRQTP